MATFGYHQLIKDNAEDIVRQVKERVEYFIEEMWPAIVEIKPPAERLEWYRNIDWNALRETSELLWAKLSLDATNLMNTEERKIAASISAYEQQAFDATRAFKAEQQPFGTPPMMDQAFVLGQNTPLPLGRLGG